MLVMEAKKGHSSFQRNRSNAAVTSQTIKIEKERQMNPNK